MCPVSSAGRSVRTSTGARYKVQILGKTFESLFFIFNVEYFRNVSNKRNELRLNHGTVQVTRAYNFILI